MPREGIMLCFPLEERRLAKWHTPVIVQPKLDGDRCRAIFDELGRVTLLSSEANEIISMPHIVDELEQTRYKNIELDGELYDHETIHANIHGLVARKVNMSEAAERIQYHIFDYVHSNMYQTYRDQALDILFPHDLDYVKRVPSSKVNDLEGIMEAMRNFTSMGYEGIIVRHPKNLYIRRRSNMIMKFKPKKQDIYRIHGYVEEVSIHGEKKGSLGALTLASHLSENGLETYFNVGTGFTRQQRKDLWEQGASLVGKWCIVQYQHLTERHVPRFPVFLKIIDQEDIMQGRML